MIASIISGHRDTGTRRWDSSAWNPTSSPSTRNLPRYRYPNGSNGGAISGATSVFPIRRNASRRISRFISSWYG